MKKKALCPLSGVHLTIKPKYATLLLHFVILFSFCIILFSSEIITFATVGTHQLTPLEHQSYDQRRIQPTRHPLCALRQ